MTGPESVVLPLHHIPICLHFFLICGCKVTTFLMKGKIIRTFFRNLILRTIIYGPTQCNKASTTNSPSNCLSIILKHKIK